MLLAQKWPFGTIRSWNRQTRVLTSRSYILKNLNVDFNKIIAVTFTNKANEIKERVNIELENSINTPIGTFHSIFAKF